MSIDGYQMVRLVFFDGDKRDGYLLLRLEGAHRLALDIFKAVAMSGRHA